MSIASGGFVGWLSWVAKLPQAVPLAVGLISLSLATAGAEDPPVGPNELRHCAGLAIDFGLTAGRPSGSCLLLSGPSWPLCRMALALASADARELQECLEWPRGGPGFHPDSDRDGVIDALDDCPLDPDKSTVGWCGCGVADIDQDGDGRPDCLGDCGGDDDDDEPCTPLEILIGTCR